MEALKTINDVLASIFQFQPIQMFIVFAIVAVFNNILEVRRRFPRAKNAVIALACIITSLAVIGISAYIKHTLTPGVDLSTEPDKALALAGVTALTYQFVKPIQVGLYDLVQKKFKEKHGIELEEPEDTL